MGDEYRKWETKYLESHFREKINRFGARRPPGAVITNEYVTPDGQATVEERQIKSYLMKSPAVPPSIADSPEFGVQIYLGKPDHGRIAVLNPSVVGLWHSKLTELSPIHSSCPILKVDPQIAKIYIEEGIHSCIIEQGIHPIGITGTCTHDQRVWSSNHYQLSYGTCKCTASYSKKPEAEQK